MEGGTIKESGQDEECWPRGDYPDEGGVVWCGVKYMIQSVPGRCMGTTWGERERGKATGLGLWGVRGDEGDGGVCCQWPWVIFPQ